MFWRLKGNQETLDQAFIARIHEQWEDEFASIKACQHQTQAMAYGREETRSFIQIDDISSLEVDVKHFAHAFRSHWSIENSCYWSLDVTNCEDDSQIRDQRLLENFGWLNRFSLSLLKYHPGRESLAMKWRSCGWRALSQRQRRVGWTIRTVCLTKRAPERELRALCSSVFRTTYCQIVHP